ncbi:hypothetical protein PROPEN_04293 [Proteus penneri ATCC 35198]|nr:hypothetical protein PROPEN_04293 [Proteus penneri ATCC 35198]
MLVGKRYTPESLKEIIQQLIQRYPNNKGELNELEEWLITAIA